MIIGSKDETSTMSGDASTIYFEQTPIVVNIPLIGKFLQQNGQYEQIVSLVAIVLAGVFILIALKVAPLIFRLEIKLKHRTDQAEEEKE